MTVDSGARGLGVDLDEDAIAEATPRAATANLPVRFEVRDAATVTGEFDAVLKARRRMCTEAFRRRSRPTRPCAPDPLRRWLLAASPSPAFFDALGGATEDELAGLNGLRAAIRDARLGIVHESLATNNKDWARYEETLAGNGESRGASGSLPRTPTGFASDARSPGRQHARLRPDAV